MNWLSKKKLEFLFCIFLLGISILLVLVVLIKHPKKADTYYVYKSNGNLEKEKVEFPLKEDFEIKHEAKSLAILFGDDSINNYDYRVRLVDGDGNSYFDNRYSGYPSNIILINVQDMLPLGKYSLLIECDDCDDVFMELGDSLNEKNSIKSNPSKSLRLQYEYVENNNSFYWYSILGIIITLTLFPMVGSDNDEKE